MRHSFLFRYFLSILSILLLLSFRVIAMVEDNEVGLSVQCTDTDTDTTVMCVAGSSYSPYMSNYIFNYSTFRYAGLGLGDAKSMMPTHMIATQMAGVDQKTVMATVLGESDSRNPVKILQGYPNLASRLGKNPGTLDYNRFTRLGLSVLESMCAAGKIDESFLMELFSRKVISFLAPLHTKEQFKKVVKFLKSDEGGVSLLAELNSISGKITGQEICVSVLDMALNEYSQHADDVFIAIVKAISSSKDRLEMFKASPVYFIYVTMALDKKLRPLLSSRDDRPLLSSHDDRLGRGLKNIRGKIRLDDQKAGDWVLKSVCKTSEGKRYWWQSGRRSLGYQIRETWGVTDQQKLQETVDFLCYKNKYQRTVNFALYGMAIPQFDDYDHPTLSYINTLNRVETYLGGIRGAVRDKALAYVALCEYPLLIKYLDEIWMQSASMQETQKIDAVIIALANSVDPKKTLPGGSRNLWHGVCFSILAIQFEEISWGGGGRNEEGVSPENKWVEDKLLNPECYPLGSSSNPHIMAQKIVEKIKAKFSKFPDEPKSDYEWNVFYARMMQACIKDISPPRI